MRKRKSEKSGSLQVYEGYAEMKLHFKNDLEIRLLCMSLQDRSYFLKYLPAHLAESGLLEPLLDLLIDCSFMQTKISDYDPLMLISDYDLVPGNKELQIIREVLRLSAHILARKPGQLWPQLYGRLFNEKEQSIHTMLADWPEGLWLRARTRSLAAPGSLLLMTLDEQDDPIAHLVVSQDGRRVVSGSESGRLRVWDWAAGTLMVSFFGDSGMDTVACTRDCDTIVDSILLRLMKFEPLGLKLPKI